MQTPMQITTNQTQAIRVYEATPLGALVGYAHSEAITVLEFIHSSAELEAYLAVQTFENKLLETLGEQLNLYFSGALKTFDLPLDPQGTAFQKEVWQALQTIPYGTTWTYKDLAEAVNRPKGYQAVGQANGKNPIVILIPCHRVIAANRQLGGYSSGLENKRKLLTLEQITWIENKRLST